MTNDEVKKEFEGDFGYRPIKPSWELEDDVDDYFETQQLAWDAQFNAYQAAHASQQVRIDALEAKLAEVRKDASRYICLTSMATKDFERAAQYQLVGRLNEFVDDIKPSVDEATNN